MTQFRITGLDSDAMTLAVTCPHCKAAPGQPCNFKVSKEWNHDLVRADKASRQWAQDLYNCRRCEYACDCSPKAARCLPTMTTTVIRETSESP